MDFAAIALQLLETLRSHPLWAQSEADAQWADALNRYALKPTPEELELVLRESFFASLHADEQRPTRFVLSLLPDQESAEISSAFIRFTEAQPVHRRALRALAPAAPPDSSLLCAQRSAGGVLCITGIHSFARDYGRPLALSFATTNPGAITVSFNNVRLMNIENGEVTTLTFTQFDEQRLERVLAAHQARDDGAVQRHRIVARLLLRAVNLIQKLGHGGSLWILRPDEKLAGTARYITSTGALFEVTNVIEKRELANVIVTSADPRENAAENLLRDVEEEAVAKTIAQLTSTDGAVLLTMEPRLLAYSAFIHNDPPVTVHDLQHGESEEVPSTELGGGRHRSAAAFCQAGKPGDRAAIVVSHDGVVSLFLNVGPSKNPVLPDLPRGVARLRLASVGAGFAFK